MRNYNGGLMHIFRQVVYYGEQIVRLRRGFRIMMDMSMQQIDTIVSLFLHGLLSVICLFMV